MKPTDDNAESPLEVVRLPLSVTTRVYDDSNPSTAERETHREAPINAGIALPLLLELDLVNWIAQFRNEPLHLEPPLSLFLPSWNRASLQRIANDGIKPRRESFLRPCYRYQRREDVASMPRHYG